MRERPEPRPCSGGSEIGSLGRIWGMGKNWEKPRVEKIRWTLALVILLLTTGYASAQGRNCLDDFLSSKSDNGDILVTGTGAVFQVLAGDEIDAMLWLPSTRLLLCSKSVVYKGKAYELWTIINTDDSEKVDAFRLK